MGRWWVLILFFSLTTPNTAQYDPNDDTAGIKVGDVYTYQLDNYYYSAIENGTLTKNQTEYDLFQRTIVPSSSDFTIKFLEQEAEDNIRNGFPIEVQVGEDRFLDRIYKMSLKSIITSINWTSKITWWNQVHETDIAYYGSYPNYSEIFEVIDEASTVGYLIDIYLHLLDEEQGINYERRYLEKILYERTTGMVTEFLMNSTKKVIGADDFESEYNEFHRLPT